MKLEVEIKVTFNEEQMKAITSAIHDSIQETMEKWKKEASQ
jgi:hypothetical protein